MRDSMRKVLYVGWIGFNNLGDELMWKAFEQLAHELLDPQKVQIIPSLPGVDLQDLSPYDTVVIGGGSLLVPGYVDVAYRAVQQKKQLLIWGSGYDTQEPVRLDAAGRLDHAQMGESDRMREMLREIGQHASFFGVRGPLTYQYLQASGVGGHLHIGGDPGMLLMPPSTPSPEQVDSKQNRPVIGINWGTSYNRIYGKNEAEVEDALAYAGRKLIEEGYDLYLYTMWGPDGNANKRLYQKIACPERTTLDLVVHDHTEMMRRIQAWEATINFKLHANVLSAACGIPFVCLAYRFKCVDFIHSLDVAELAVTTDEQDLAQRILSRAKYAISYKDTIRSSIASKQQQMIDNLRAPFVNDWL